jgi:hypothetical protein
MCRAKIATPLVVVRPDKMNMINTVKASIIYFASATLTLVNATPITGTELLCVGLPIVSLGWVPFLWFISTNRKNFESFMSSNDWTYATRILFGLPKNKDK